MEVGAVVERVEHIAGVRTNPAAGADLIETGLVAIREVRAWLDSQHAGLVRQLKTVDSFPEKRIAGAAKGSLSKAANSTERATTLDTTPKLAEALDDGEITSEHVDAVTRVSKRLEPSQRGELQQRADDLVDVAKAGTGDEFAHRLELEAKRIQGDNGIDRLERQRRNARARSWVDAEGMWNLSAKFDPVTGVNVAARIDAMVQTLFGTAVPAECPTDPIEKQHYLNAQAVTQLLLDHAVAGTRPAKPEFVVVVDADAPGTNGPIAEFSIPVEIPTRVLAELAGNADAHTVVVRNGIVLYAPGELNLGRATRLANRAQRRALRGLYRCCAIPGCTITYERCKLHHIIWWRNGGTTNLHNLIPLCSVHHGRIHNDNWTIELGPNRQLTLRLPDGNIHTTAPPGRRRTAA